MPTVENAKGGEALAADLRLEESQLERYRRRFSQGTDLGLADVAEALRPLLEQAHEHVRDLQTALGRETARIGASARASARRFLNLPAHYR